ncbi:biliverdin-producing heme oxygenase [Roseomonas sp. 18066]|uniref:biliverdin-producing heme oxygenase n=1 Tax=Roseomonas sp. 18066 TaxID=2681412 RepID=UPI00135CB3B4|nr:biliverdin-producing heme oxygenase [Roseomonas sp. 18066]
MPPDLPPTEDRKTGLRWSLRAATGPLHAEADALGSAHALGTRDGHAAFLRAHARALPGLEAAVGAALAQEAWLGWDARRRLPALLADLAVLGTAAPDPLPVVWPAGDRRAVALGAAYVLEGSRLGNAMLRRGLPEGAPAAYLAHQPAGGAGWPGFLAGLEAALPDPAGWPAAEAGARLAFSTFLAALRTEA